MNHSQSRWSYTQHDSLLFRDFHPPPGSPSLLPLPANVRSLGRSERRGDPWISLIIQRVRVRYTYTYNQRCPEKNTKQTCQQESLTCWALGDIIKGALQSVGWEGGCSFSHVLRSAGFCMLCCYLSQGGWLPLDKQLQSSESCLRR